MADFDIAFENDELDIVYNEDSFGVNFTTTTEFTASFTSEEFQVDFSEGGHQGPGGNNAQYVFFFVIDPLIVSPGNPTDDPDNWVAESDVSEDTKVYFWAVADQKVNPDGTVVPIVSSDWRIVAFPGSLDPAEVDAAVAAYLAENPVTTVSTDANNAITAGSDGGSYYDNRGKANITDLATFEDRTLDTPVEYRLDEIEYDTLSDGHRHEFLFKFENALGQIGEKAVATQAPIHDGRPATNANFTDDTDTGRYATVATVKHWAGNEFLEDNQLLLSSDSSDTATVTGIAEVPTADWLNNVWRPFYIPAGTRPANWADIGGSDVDAFVPGQTYATNENFTFGNSLYSVNSGAAFANAAAAISNSTLLINGDAGSGTAIAPYSPSATYVLDDFVYNPTNGIIYRSLGNNAAGSSLVNPMLWQSLGGATQFAPIPVTAENLTSINIPDDTVGTELQLSSNNVETGLGVPNDNTRIFGINGIDVTAHGTEDIIVINGSASAPVIISLLQVLALTLLVLIQIMTAMLLIYN